MRVRRAALRRPPLLSGEEARVLGKCLENPFSEGRKRPSENGFLTVLNGRCDARGNE